ncbi:sulfatase [Ruficoccus sp. ZRK36]|uniref:sulfatase family protein n=1 Tax=Ruficoccus sp. ZRK36 TaxID=2866311 RepID=UPI001C72BD1A|nr:sulfatase [Ruficoccus sp. ZRK36]QYY37240.1 sulfatase [Ruficoccus sp. ZRK36]
MKPNILLLHSHDLGDLIGCYPGNSSVTPHLDKLAAEGVVFEQHFAAAPTCSPSRGANLTGLAPTRNGLIALATDGIWEVNRDVKLLPEMMQEAGYKTGNFGAWHITGDETHRGFDKFSGEFPDSEIVDNALAWMEEVEGDQPFFCTVGLIAPHRPFTDNWRDLQDPDDVVVPPYLKDTPVVREEMRRFYGDTSMADEQHGRLIDFIKQKGLDENTIIIFTVDHGIGMPRAKGSLYDPGLKIPLIVRWKGQVEGGRRFGGLTCNTDLVPTIMEAIGESRIVPEGIDGKSLWSFVSEGKDVGHKYVFAEQTWHDFYEPIRSIRTASYKLIWNFEPGPGLQLPPDTLYSSTTGEMRQMLRDFERPEFELYDLDADPDEQVNLAGRVKYSEIEKELKATLLARLEEIEDPILKGPIPSVPGYFEHFLYHFNCGGLPLEPGRENWLPIKWPFGRTARYRKVSPDKGVQ